MTTTYKKLVLKYHDNARFPSLCLGSEYFLAVFTHKMAITEWKTTISKIIFKFILKATCKKLFQNARTMQGFLHCARPPGMDF